MSPSFSLPCFARLPVFVAPFPAFSLGEAVRIVKVRLTAVFRGRSTISEWRKKRPENDSYWRRRCFLVFFLLFFFGTRNSILFSNKIQRILLLFYYFFSLIEDLFNFIKFYFSIVDSAGYIFFFGVSKNNKFILFILSISLIISILLLYFALHILIINTQKQNNKKKYKR